MKEEENLLTAEEVVATFDVSRPTLHTMAKAGEIKQINKRGRRRVFYFRTKCENTFMRRDEKYEIR